MQTKITSRFLKQQGLSRTFVTRFASKVDKNGPIPEHRPKLGKCWLWTGFRNKDGYGYIGKGPKSVVAKAHRGAWLISRGSIPSRLFVLHKCDNPSCVRPSHLFLGTHLDNAKDMVSKNRQSKGERNGRPKLTSDAVIEIRNRYAKGENNGMELAAIYGVSAPLIYRIIHREKWRHI